MSVRLELCKPSRAPLTLGEIHTFQLVSDDGPVRGDFFLRHEGIHYLTPLTRTPTDTVSIYADAPGHFTLYARWTDAHESPAARLEFDVNGAPGTWEPKLVALDWKTKVWAPNRWEASVSARHESRAVKRLLERLRPGGCVYDIGAHIGLFAVRCAQKVGSSGQIYCFEPNPLCVYFLRANLSRARAPHFEIFPICVSDTRSTLEFTVNYGNNLLGIGQPSAYADKPGHKIKVDGDSIDNLCDQLELRPPSCIKVDVEGAEGAVVAGMLNTLGRHRPVLFMELHGRMAAQPVLDRLQPLGYAYREMGQDREFTDARQLAEWLPDTCVQVIGLP